MAKSTNISVQNGSGYLIVGETPRADARRRVQTCAETVWSRECAQWTRRNESSSGPSLIKLKLIENREICQQCLEDDWI